MNKFKSGQSVSARSIGDHDCIFSGAVINRTAKTVTINTPMKGVKRCKIFIDTDGSEYAFPFGQYSMAPIFRA